MEDDESTSLGVQRTILAKVNSLLEMKAKIDSIENSMSFLTEKYDEVLKEVSQLRTENLKLRKELQDVKTSEESTQTQVNNLTSEIAELNQYGRRMNLEIQGLPVEGDLQSENMKSVLEKVAQDIGVRFEPELIHQAHRLQPRNNGRPPTVIVQFHSKETRDRWIQRGRSAKLNRNNNKVFFNENLCPQYRQLLREAKARANAHKYLFVWFSGGQIRVKKDENTKNVIVVKNMGDLNKIR